MHGKVMRSSLIVALCLGLMATAGPAVAEEINREFHQEFDVQPGMKLVLEHGDGDVTVTPWSQDTLDVEVRYRVSSGWRHDSCRGS